MSAWRIATRSAAAVVSPLTAVLFPTTCWATAEAIAPADRGLSSEAREQIARQILWPYCLYCGSTLGLYSDRAQPCGRCPDRDLGVGRIIRVGTYDPPLGELIRKLKFGRRWELARVLAPFLYQAMTLQAADAGAPLVDALIPVALHWRRKWSRGFNQSEELARELSALGHWPVLNALHRVRATMEQSHTLSAAQRKENLRDAFVALPRFDLAGKHVWLIDDVTTTGATLHAAATALRKLPKGHRPKGIHAAVICVTDHVPAPVGV